MHLVHHYYKPNTVGRTIYSDELYFCIIRISIASGCSVPDLYGILDTSA